MRHGFPISHFLMLFDSLRKKQGCKHPVLGSELVSVSFLRAAQVFMCWPHCEERHTARAEGAPGAALPAPFLVVPPLLVTG